jgi:hypothetical protein
MLQNSGIAPLRRTIDSGGRTDLSLQIPSTMESPEKRIIGNCGRRDIGKNWQRKYGSAPASHLAGATVGMRPPREDTDIIERLPWTSFRLTRSGTYTSLPARHAGFTQLFIPDE